MGTFTGYLKYKNPDWTASINKRTKEAWNKGIWAGADVTPVGSNMDVYIAPFVAHGKDGLVIFYEGSSAIVTVPATGLHYILLHSYYIGGAEPLMEFVAMDNASWDLLTSLEKDDYIIIATVNTSTSSIVIEDISFKEKNSLDIIGRNEFRGTVNNIATLPVDKNNKDCDMWIVFDSSSDISPKLVIWNDVTKLWIDIHDDTLNAVLESHRGNGIGIKTNAMPIDNEKHLTNDEYDGITNTTPLSLNATNHIVGSTLPLAKNDKENFSLHITPADHVTLLGSAYIGKGAVGSANKFFKLVIQDTLANLTGTDGGIILVESIYDDTNTSELNPGVDADVNGFYINPTIRFDMSGTSMVLYNNTLDVIFGSITNLGSLLGEDILLAGQVNDFRNSASGVLLGYSGFNIFTTPTNQLEFDIAVDNFLYPSIEYNLSTSSDNKLFMITNTSGDPTYSLTHFSQEQIINGITVTGTNTIEYIIDRYAYGVPAKTGLFFISELNGSVHNQYYMVTEVNITISGTNRIIELELINMNDVNPNFTIGHTAIGYICNGFFNKNDGLYSGISLQRKKTSDNNALSLLINRSPEYSTPSDKNIFVITDPVDGDVFKITESGYITIYNGVQVNTNGNDFNVNSNGGEITINSNGGLFELSSAGENFSIYSGGGLITLNSNNNDIYFNAGTADINITTAGMYVNNGIEAESFSLNALSPKTIFQGTEGMTGLAITNSGYTNEGFINFYGGVAASDTVIVRVPINPGDKYIYSDIKVNAIALTPLKKIVVTLYSKNINDLHWTNVTSQDYGSTPGDIPFITGGSFSLSPLATAFTAVNNTIYAIGIQTNDITSGSYNIMTVLGSYWELELADPERGFI